MKFLENRKKEIYMSKTQLTLSGRIVWSLSPSGNPMERVPAKSKEGQQLYDKSGKPMMKTVFSLAIPKNSPQLAMLQEAQQAEIYKLYPSGQLPKNFAMKIVDGDTEVDDKGKPYSMREGHAGHMVVSFSSLWEVKWYQFDGVNYQEINAGVKTGDFVDVNFTLTAHSPSPKGGVAGFYVEPKAILFTGVGDAIVKKVQATDPSKLFGMGAAQPQANPQVFQQQAPQQPAQQANPFAQQPAAQPAWNQQQFAPQAQPAAPAVQPAPVQAYYGGLPPQFQK